MHALVAEFKVFIKCFRSSVLGRKRMTKVTRLLIQHRRRSLLRKIDSRLFRDLLVVLGNHEIRVARQDAPNDSVLVFAPRLSGKVKRYESIFERADEMLAAEA